VEPDSRIWPAVLTACRPSTEGDFDLLAHDERWDLHAITGLLKMFLREVPSILTHELHMHFLAVTGKYRLDYDEKSRADVVLQTYGRLKRGFKN
jgi:hypothetical protein